MEVDHSKPAPTFFRGWSPFKDLSADQVEEMEARALAKWQEGEAMDKSLRQLAGESLTDSMYFG